jgi:hypothetical protein
MLAHVVARRVSRRGRGAATAAADAWRALGVAPGDARAARDAFRRAAHALHPDKPGGDAHRFRELLEAYRVAAAAPRPPPAPTTAVSLGSLLRAAEGREAVLEVWRAAVADTASVVEIDAVTVVCEALRGDLAGLRGVLADLLPLALERRFVLSAAHPRAALRVGAGTEGLRALRAQARLQGAAGADGVPVAGGGGDPWASSYEPSPAGAAAASSTPRPPPPAPTSSSAAPAMSPWGGRDDEAATAAYNTALWFVAETEATDATGAMDAILGATHDMHALGLRPDLSLCGERLFTFFPKRPAAGQ